MSRLFISNSGADNAEAVAIRTWLAEAGWDDAFLDLDAERGIRPGERWERALNEAASRCEAVLFLLSPSWLGSAWCLEEFHLARHLNKTLVGAIISADVTVDDLPDRLKSIWQVVNLADGSGKRTFRITPPHTEQEVRVAFSQMGIVVNVDVARHDPRPIEEGPPLNDNLG